MMYRYEDLGYDQFENLIILLCQKLLGISVKGFSKGADGGRDAKFVGKAQLHPSTTAPWAGTVIIQAKHTNGYNRHFGEADFYSLGSVNTIIGEEVPRIKKLRKAGQIDHYMLFANRRLTANSDETITAYLANKCDLPYGSIYLCGIEQLELWFKRFPTVAKLAQLDPVDSPLIVSPEELALVVEALANHDEELSAVLDPPPSSRTAHETKNAINNMTAEYAKAQRKFYLKDTAQIRTFLAAPENSKLLKSYETATEEFQLKIISKRKEFQNFDSVMNYLIDLLFGRDPILRQTKHKRLTRALLFYMYWNCDIGEIDNAEAE